MDDNSQYLELFFQETDDHLQGLNELVLDLERDPSDPRILDEIFRSAHTLKGMAATMGFATMEEVTHNLENVFSLLKAQEVETDGRVISLVFKSLDALAEIVEDIRAGREVERDYSEVIAMCEHVTGGEGTAAMKPAAPFDAQMDTLELADYEMAEAAGESGYRAYTLAIQLDADSMMANVRAFMVLQKLSEFGEVMKSEPTAEVLEAEEFGHTFKCFYLSELEAEAVREKVLEVSEVEEVLVQPLQAPQKVEAAAVKKEGPLPSATSSHSHNQSIRVDISKLDSFMNLVSELVIYRTQLEDIGKKTENRQLTDTLTYVSRITDQLQSLVLNIRMQPLHVVMSRFPRLVRDLSTETGKQIDLVIEGDDTELDRTIVSELGEPLIHLIRNSADHGIEMPEVRQAMWKSPKGVIKISAYQEGNRVFISVADDGKGLDVAAIKASAEQKGISTEGLSNQEIQGLIFHPGFSTASEVTKISGRGVGMDAVQSKIEELGGTIETTSTPNVGTTFRLSLPLTLSIIPALLVKVEQHTFALPLNVIQHVVHATGDNVKQTHNGEVLMHRGRAIPLIRLEEQLEMAGNQAESTHVVVVSIEGREYALSVDDIVGQQEIVIKELGPEFKQQQDYLGAAIMGDGSIVLILNVTSICLERNRIAYV